MLRNRKAHQEVCFHSVFLSWVTEVEKLLIMVDLNEHSQCHLQGVVRDIEVWVISYSDPALQVITAGHGIRHKAVSL